MCAGWRNSFVSFRHDMGRRPLGKTLDRRDNNGHYSCGHCVECKKNGWPKNARWATFRQQQANREHPHEAHGLTSNGTIPREYTLWCALRRRAKRDGIEISDRWLSYKKFIADVGRRPGPRHRIYRLLNKGAFIPGNALWLSVPEREEERRKSRPRKPRVYVRSGFCIRGHRFSKTNTYVRSNGCRYCRACRRNGRPIGRPRKQIQSLPIAA
jgi:hypothetical protein